MGMMPCVVFAVLLSASGSAAAEGEPDSLDRPVRQSSLPEDAPPAVALAPRPAPFSQPYPASWYYGRLVVPPPLEGAAVAYRGVPAVPAQPAQAEPLYAALDAPYAETQLPLSQRRLGWRLRGVKRSVCESAFDGVDERRMPGMVVTDVRGVALCLAFD